MLLVCGEALFDFFMNTASGNGLNFTAHTGGSPYNVAVGLRRLGTPVAFFAGLSNDFLGQALRRALLAEGVDTRYVVSKSAPTTMSFIMAGTEGVPQYEFYGQGGADRALQPNEIPALGGMISGLHFGSYSLVCEPTGGALLALGRRETGRLVISLDPNVRLNVVPDLDIWRGRIAEWVRLANIIKVSAEDLDALYPQSDPAAVARAWLAAGAALIVVTNGATGASAFTARYEIEVPGIVVPVVDTVGAGDTFQAALLSRLAAGPYFSPAGLAGLDKDALLEILLFANAAAAVTCTRGGADLPTNSEVESLRARIDAGRFV